jgi:phage head maturation protease
MLSNSPAEDMKHVRALVAEGHLRTLSMGGRFYYRNDGRGIFKVELYEGSLTPIPANPDATFSTRALTDEEMKTVQFGAAA